MHEQQLNHRCGWPSCGKLVAISIWGCRVHWYALPLPLRGWIRRAYLQGIADDDHPSLNYRRAHRAALEWIAAYEANKPLPQAYRAAYHSLNQQADKKGE